MTASRWRSLVRAVLPAGCQQWCRRVRQAWTAQPPIGEVKLGDLAAREPISRQFGFDRGQCIDRYYIERFLAQAAPAINGRVLEIGDAHYTRTYGGARVTQSDVLHAVAGNAEATLVGDLCTGQGVPLGVFDALVLTQTLPFLYDLQGAVRTMHQALKPGGVALLTFAGISQISRYDDDRWGDYWRLTPRSATRLFGEVFGDANVSVTSHGNVLTCVALLHGLSVADLGPGDLEHMDPDYPLIITVRAVRAAENG